MPRKQKKPELQVNDVVRTIPELDLQKMMRAQLVHVRLRKADCVGHIEKIHRGEVFVRHVEDDNTAVYDPEELVPAENEAYWRYYHTIEGVSGYSELRTYAEAVKHGKTRGVQMPTMTLIYEIKEDLDEDFALPVRSLFDLLSDDDD